MHGGEVIYKKKKKHEKKIGLLMSIDGIKLFAKEWNRPVHPDTNLVESAEAAEYTDCISAEG